MKSESKLICWLSRWKHILCSLSIAVLLWAHENHEFEGPQRKFVDWKITMPNRMQAQWMSLQHTLMFCPGLCKMECLDASELPSICLLNLAQFWELTCAKGQTFLKFWNQEYESWDLKILDHWVVSEFIWLSKNVFMKWHQDQKEYLKSLLMKEESEKVDLKLNIQKTKIVASNPITSW